MFELYSSILLRRRRPNVTVLDVRSDASDLTTYTFTGVNVGDLGTTEQRVDSVSNPFLKTPSKKSYAIIVHGEDAATLFDVSSVQFGGTSGTQAVDRAGGTSAINTAIFMFGSGFLDFSAGTDVTVNFSEAVTGCAIGVVLIENMGTYDATTTASAVGTGVLSASATLTITASDRDMLILAGATCAVNTETCQFYIGEATSTVSNAMPPTLLYQGSNAEFAYAAAWTYAPSYAAGNATAMTATWSGTGAGDLVTAVFY